MMLQEIEAVFNGTALQLEKPLNLAAGTRVRIIVESVLPDKVEPPKTFLKTAESLKLHDTPDWSEKIDQYLYGETIGDND
jgi:predicted DNA-binding antitoxin AbrB/MazE fold protein